MLTRDLRLICLGAFFVGALLPATARGDAGAVQLRERHGKRQITVFTDPTPVRAGTVDVSVLVQDVATGSLVDEKVEVHAAPRGESGEVRYRATTAAASNKMFKAAHVDLPSAGWWEFTVEIGAGPLRVPFAVEVGEPLPNWQALWPWFTWPLAVIALFAMVQAGRGPRGLTLDKRSSSAETFQQSGTPLPRERGIR